MTLSNLVPEITMPKLAGGSTNRDNVYTGGVSGQN